jgi:hypothetical protein
MAAYACVRFNARASADHDPEAYTRMKARPDVPASFLVSLFLTFFIFIMSCYPLK